MVGYDKGELGKTTHEEKDDERVGEGNQKGRDAIVPECSLLFAAYVHVLRGVGAEGDDAEDKENDATKNLKQELCFGIVDQVHYERHTEAGNHGVDDVGDRSTDARDKSVPSSLVERTLNT